jgi:hypothetical protein
VMELEYIAAEYLGWRGFSASATSVYS